MTRPIVAVFSLFVLATGCLGPRVLGDSDTETTSTSTTTSTTTTTTTTTTTSTTSAEVTTAPVDSSGDDPVETADPICEFICPPDAGPPSIECDIWAQDCPLGQKCMPWANDGGNAWNATRCSPLDPTPAQVGEPCMVEGSGVSGIDDCALAAMCFGVDAETGMGICFDFCRGSESNPTCLDPASECHLTGDGVLILCLPRCEPLAQNCSEGQACYPANDTFTCVPDASAELGAYGDVCEFINACDPGLFCADAATVPDCESDIGCCSDFCDLAAGDPDAMCTGAPQGQVCVPWYDAGQAPPGLVNVGAFLLPE